MRSFHVAVCVAAVILVGAETSSASPAKGDAAGPAKEGVVKQRRHRSRMARLSHRLALVSPAPAGEAIAESPSVHDGERGSHDADVEQRGFLELERDGRHFKLGFDEADRFHVSEGKKVRWSASPGGAGGPEPDFTLEPGAEVVIVGHSRVGYRAFGLLDGKELAKVGSFRVAPGGSYGVVSPARRFGTDCVAPSSFSRLALDASHALTKLDIPSVPRALAEGRKSYGDHPYHASLTFLPSGERFVVASDAGVFLFDGGTGKRLASAPLPFAGSDEDKVAVHFAKSGSFVIVTRERDEKKSDFFWLRID